MLRHVTFLMRHRRLVARLLERRLGRLAMAACAVALLAATGYALRPAPLALAEITVARDPGFLNDADRTTYTALFDALDHHNEAAVKELLPQLRNPVLLGDVLATRYLSPNYTPSNDELTAWLNFYGDQRQAPRIAALARSRGLAVPAIEQGRPLKGDGYAFHLGRTTMPDGWYEALRLWKDQQFTRAAALFNQIGNNTTLNAWQRSAGSYWAYRSLLRSGATDEAATALDAAAKSPFTFYGQLALAREGRGLPVRATAPTVPYRLRIDGHVARARAYSELGMNDDAEESLRHLYSEMSPEDYPALATLAAELDLPNLQLRAAQLPGLSTAQKLFASYPAPGDMVTAASGVIDPALVLAVARHESSFHPSVASNAGARGMMQMLPSTAQHVLRSVAREELSFADNDTDLSIAQRLNDAALSSKLGATYLRMLEKEPAVGDSLMKMLAAYNAGPGAVAAWQSSARHMNDPLLYLESIPYPETHNYVLQVLAHYWIYQNLMGQHPTSLSELAHGQWPTIS